MTIGGISEITVYVLAVMQAVSVGLILAFAQGVDIERLCISRASS